MLEAWIVLSEPLLDPIRIRNGDYWILLHSEPIGLTTDSMETRVTLRPGAKGTKALVAEHGQRLICVR